MEAHPALLVNPLDLTLINGPRFMGYSPEEAKYRQGSGRWQYTIFQWIADSVRTPAVELWNRFQALGHSFVPPGDKVMRWHDPIWWSEGVSEPQFGGTPDFSTPVYVSLAFANDVLKCIALGIKTVKGVEHDPRCDHDQSRPTPTDWSGCRLKPIDCRAYVSRIDNRQRNRCLIGFDWFNQQVVFNNGDRLWAIQAPHPQLFTEHERVDRERTVSRIKPIDPSILVT